MAYASQCCPGGIGFAMSENPMGPWIYKGDIVPHSPRRRANHPGIIDYKGKSYVFSMNLDLYHFKSAKHAVMPKNDEDIGNPNQIVYDIDDGEYLKIKGVDFAKGAESFVVSALCHLYGGKIEIRVDSPYGKCLGNVTISNTLGEYKLFECKIKNVKGIHALYFVFKGSEEQLHNLFVLDWWKFENKQ